MCFTVAELNPILVFCFAFLQQITNIMFKSFLFIYMLLDSSNIIQEKTVNFGRVHTYIYLIGIPAMVVSHGL